MKTEKTKTINSRERVLKVFKILLGKPDRIPVQFEMCRRLYDHFGKVLGIPVNYTENLYEDVTYRISANELRVAMEAMKNWKMTSSKKYPF